MADHHFEGHLCAHVAISCSCQVEAEDTHTMPQENNNPLLPELKIMLQSSHNRITDGMSVTVSSQSNTRMDVIQNFKSYDLVKDAVSGMLSYLEAPQCCFDYVTDCVLNCAYGVQDQRLGGSFRITARVEITMNENLDVEEEHDHLIDDVVTGSIEGDSVRRIPAAKSFIDGLKKEEYRHNGDSNDSSSATTSCAVCLEGILDGSEISNMPCSHMFHSACLITWLQESNSCPMCRHQVDPAE
ncbi:hypothetical protein MKX01_042327 [Papaver californicum]|nr:hypothetical protein MKX01_042327 [Papaver californicum]